MDCYVGLYASLKKTSICVVDSSGRVPCEGVVDSQPGAIAKFLKSKAPGAVRIGIETGPTSIWLTTELRALGLPVICIDARHAKAVLKMQINKSDRNDAAGIARIMQTGWFKEVRLKGFDSHAVRALLTSRAMLVKIKRDLENQIRGLLKIDGLLVGTAKGNMFSRRVVELARQCPELAVSVGPLLAAREAVDKQLCELDRRVLRLAPGGSANTILHDRTRRRPGYGALLPSDYRRSSSLQPIPECGRLCWADHAAVLIWRGRLDRSDIEMRRPNAAQLPLRGCWRVAHAGAEMVGAQGVGDASRQA
jgi:transposase